MAKLDLDKILKEYEIDCEIDEFNLAGSQRKVPSLHAKYLKYLSETKLELIKQEGRQKDILKDKWLYYSGKMDRESIESRGWPYDPYDGITVMKQEKEYFYSTDPDIKKSEEKIQYLKTIIDTLKEIIENLKWKHQTIKNIIEVRKFESGS